jgi:hypothetical protein
MRTLTGAATTALATQYGLEPYLVVEIAWDGSTTGVYATKDMLTYDPRILDVGPIDDKLTYDNFNVTTTSVTIDDTDGVIKAIIASKDIHKRPCSIYQMFTGLADVDKILLFTGTISSPFTWSEGERQVTFSVTSEVEHFEIGFSPEEGQLSWVTEEAIGKPWPLVFGDVLHVPAVKVKQIQHAKMLDLFTIPDPILYYKLQQCEAAYQQSNFLFTFYQMLHTGIHLLIPSAATILSDYVTHLLAMKTLLAQQASLVADMALDRNAVGIAPVGLAARTAFRTKWNVTLPNLAAAMQPIATLLETDKQNIAYLQWLYDLDKQTIGNMVNEYNNMRSLWAAYREIQLEICLEESTEVATVRVEGESIYPDDTDVCIRKARFTVHFDHTLHTMTFTAGPIDQYVGAGVQVWTPDDEPCSGIAAMDGVDMFRLSENPPPDLNDMYLLIKASGVYEYSSYLTLTGSSGYVHVSFGGIMASMDFAPVYGSLTASGVLAILNLIPALNGNVTVSGSTGGPWTISSDTIDINSLVFAPVAPSGVSNVNVNPNTRHIVKVRKQDGQKVYYDIKQWAIPNTGSGHGHSIGTIVNQIVNPASWTYAGGLGGSVPSGYFTGDMDPAIWSQPQGALLLSILASIPGGVNQEELKELATVCFLQAFDSMRNVIINIPTSRDIYTIIGEDIGVIKAASSVIPNSWWQNWSIPAEEIPEKMGFEAQPGAEIKDCDDHCEIYIANLLPSTIAGVHAYRKTDTGDDVLDTVPSTYYIKDESKNLGTYDVTCITLKRALYEIPGENWTDQLYISLSSSVGPNVVDVIQYLIETYTDKTVDAVSFAAVKTKVTKYPVNFAIFTRPDVLQELKRICWEARIAILLKGGVFYLTYLSETPTSRATWTNAAIVDKTYNIAHTPTESLVTRMVAQYSLSYLPLRMHELQPKHVLRYNIDKYGLHEREETFHVYNDADLVYKSAAFWLLRLANTWQNLELEAFWLDKIEFELLDAVTLNGILCVIVGINYNPILHTINMTLDTPIRAGESTAFPFYWPATGTPALIGESFGVGSDPGTGVTGTINDCDPYIPIP